MKVHPDTSSKFDAMVLASKNGRLNNNGERVDIVGWLAEHARAIDVEKFIALQEAYDGKLEIINERGHVLLRTEVMACSSKFVREQSRLMSARIRKHLDIVATVQ